MMQVIAPRQVYGFKPELGGVKLNSINSKIFIQINYLLLLKSIH